MLSITVAGFDKSDLDITVQENRLVVSGRMNDKAREQEEKSQYLYRGIAGRAFRHAFELADTVRVTGAALANGLLHVDLVREIPERAKPRQIEITHAGDKPAAVIDTKAA